MGGILDLMGTEWFSMEEEKSGDALGGSACGRENENWFCCNYHVTGRAEYGMIVDVRRGKRCIARERLPRI